MLYLYLTAFAVFLCTVFLVVLIGRVVTTVRARRRLAEVLGASAPPVEEKPRAHVGAGSLTRVEAVINSLSKLSLPEQGWQDSAVQLKFIRAGLRGPNDIKIFYAIKSVLTFVMPGVVFLILWRFAPDLTRVKLISYVVVVAAAGYYLPDLFMRWRTSRRIQQMQDTLPDLIDLLIICTESGLGIDAAINRVARDSVRNSPLLSQEFYLTSLEIRAGAGRLVALRNMALRTNLDDLNGFVSMLIQADKFGTSIAESLRIQSDMMRVKRIQRAEEKAAKVPVKMLLPLILFIFPVLMIVLIGPAFMQMSALFSK